MGVHSGKWGVVDGAETIKNWTVTDEQTLADAVASNTKMGHARRRGVESWSGGFGFFGHTPPAMPGDLFSFSGYTAPENNVSGAGLVYSGDGMVKQVQVNWNWGSGELISGQLDFDGHLGLNAASDDQIVDSSVPTLPAIVLAKVMYSTNGTDWTDWPNLVTVALTMTCAVQAYVDSGTVVAGPPVRLWTGQVAGTIDWNMSITEHNNLRSLFSKGDQLAFRLYVSATEYYELFWGRVKNFTGITVNRDTGAIIQQTVQIEMDGVKESDGSIGHITLPGEADPWWPNPLSS